MEPLEEVNSAPWGRKPLYSSVPAHMVWNHFRLAAPLIISGRGQPNTTVAAAICSGVTVPLLA